MLGLIFLRFAEARFESVREKIEAKATARRKPGPPEYRAEGVIHLVDAARFSYLLNQPESADLGKALNEAMRLIEEHNPDLSRVLPHTYAAMPNSTIASLLATSRAIRRTSKVTPSVSSTSTSWPSSPWLKARARASSSPRLRSSA